MRDERGKEGNKRKTRRGGISKFEWEKVVGEEQKAQKKV